MLTETKELPRLIFTCMSQATFGGFHVNISEHEAFGRTYIDLDYESTNVVDEAKDHELSLAVARLYSHSCSYHSYGTRGWYYLRYRDGFHEMKIADIKDTDWRIEVRDDFTLLFEILDVFGIKVNKMDISGYTNPEDLLHALDRETPAEVKEREKQEKEAREGIIHFANNLADITFALKKLMEKLSGVPEQDYIRFCRGTLRKNRYTQELKELKTLTDKVVHYVPEIAETADAVSNSARVMAKAYQGIKKITYGSWMQGRSGSWKTWMQRLLESMYEDEVLIWSQEDTRKYIEGFFDENYDAIVRDIKKEIE